MVREDIFKPTVGKWSLHEDKNGNGNDSNVFHTKRILILDYDISAPKNSYNDIWNFADGKNRIRIDHVLINRRCYSRIRNVRYFRGAEYDRDYYQVTEKDCRYVNKHPRISMWRDLLSRR